MSVIQILKDKDEEKAIILCTLSWMSKLFSCMTDTESISKTTLLHNIFEVKTPFLMDGEAKKLSLLLSKDRNEDVLLNENNNQILHNYFDQKAKKTKLDCVLSPKEKANLTFIHRKFDKLKSIAEFSEHFCHFSTAEDFQLNNRRSREAAKLVLDASDVTLQNITGKNDGTSPVIHDYQGHKYLIPSSCQYIVADVYDLQSFLKGQQFDIVVIDPPWHNKHIRRKRHLRGLSHGYNTLSVEEIMEIPLQSVLSAGAFVFIWVTNNAKMNEMILDSLHSWNLELLGTWFWLKVTTCGYPVVSLNSSLARGKLPYEKLLVARSTGAQTADRRSFPDHLRSFLFITVPSTLHSHKPPLKDLIQHLLNVGTSEKCLELFARYLTPGWTSMGLEALRLQDLALLQQLGKEAD